MEQIMNAAVMSPTTSPRNRLTESLPVSERHLTLDGIYTAVLEAGEGRPIVLLHGPGAYGAHFFTIIPALAKSFRVIAPDLPGHGASGFFAEAPTPDMVNAWLEDLIDCTCASPPVLIGSTLGGVIAAYFAADHARQIAGLVLVDSLGLGEFQPEALFGQALHAYLAAPDEKTHDALWAQCAFDFPAVRRRLGGRMDLLREYNLAGLRRPGGLDALKSWMEQLGVRAIPESTLARIKVPTTLIWGRQDRATALGVAEAAQRRYGWPLYVIDAAADDPSIDQPDALVDTLQRVLAAS
jgi:pimeloyl-ACP methyl ester carboxylesterase